MRWSTQTAIYPPFVPLRSFKKANSLKADRVREGGRERESDIDPLRLQLYIKWIKLIKVASTVCILSTSFKWKGPKTCIQYLMNFHKEDERKGGGEHAIFRPLGCPSRNRKYRRRGGRYEYGQGLPTPHLSARHRRASHSRQSAAANRQLIPSTLPEGCRSLTP